VAFLDVLVFKLQLDELRRASVTTGGFLSKGGYPSAQARQRPQTRAMRRFKEAGVNFGANSLASSNACRVPVSYVVYIILII